MQYKVHFLLFLNFWLIKFSFGILSLWWRDVIREATFYSFCSYKKNAKNIKIWFFVLFIVSEIAFFFAFFWAFFHSSLAPTIQIGSIFLAS